jgi:hypothetical protein
MYGCDGHVRARQGAGGTQAAQPVRTHVSVFVGSSDSEEDDGKDDVDDGVDEPGRPDVDEKVGRSAEQRVQRHGSKICAVHEIVDREILSLRVPGKHQRPGQAQHARQRTRGEARKQAVGGVPKEDEDEERAGQRDGLRAPQHRQPPGARRAGVAARQRAARRQRASQREREVRAHRNQRPVRQVDAPAAGVLRRHQRHAAEQHSVHEERKQHANLRRGHGGFH